MAAMVQFVTVGLFLLALCIGDVEGKKKGKETIDPFSGKVIKPLKTLKKKEENQAEFETNKAKIFKKLRTVKTNEDFFKAFKIPYTPVILQKPQRPPTDLQQDVGYYIKTKGIDGVLRDSAKPVEFKEVVCKPSMVITPIKYSSLYASFPSCVGINQCGGCCNNVPNIKCMPTVFESQTLNVFRISYADSSIKMVPTKFLAHKECRCQCSLKQMDCLPTQTLDKENCECKCEKKEKDAKCGEFKRWSAIACKCVCKTKQQKCGEMKVWDTNTCGCVCKKTNCPDDQVQDSLSCHCGKLLTP